MSCAPRKHSRGRTPVYSAKLGEAVYRANRTRSRRRRKTALCGRFIKWVKEKVFGEYWSFDACVGYARLYKLFREDEMVCTHTLYNAMWAGHLPITPNDVPQALKRKSRKTKQSRNRQKNYGRSIDAPPCDS